jgi:mttA/Hcf106 family
MFGLGAQELLLILLIALFSFGGEKLPDIAKGLNRATQHWYTGSARKRVIAVYPGHQVSECHVE